MRQLVLVLVTAGIACCHIIAGFGDIDASEVTSGVGAAGPGPTAGGMATTNNGGDGGVADGGDGGVGVVGGDAGQGGVAGAGGQPPTVKRVFVTSQSTYGNLMGIGMGADGLAGGDNLCDQAAGNLGAGGWVAWLSTDTVDAIDRINDVTGGWYLVDQTTHVATDKAQLASGTLSAAIDRDENGMQPPGEGLVWTGTDVDGTHNPEECQNWSNNGAFGGLVGLLDRTDSQWTAGPIIQICQNFTGAGGNNFPAHIYCFEQ